MTSRVSISRPEGQAERQLTKAEQQRIQERHHVERVLRQARSGSIPKWLRVVDGRLLGVRLSWVPIGAAIIAACALLALSIVMVVQNGDLSRRLTALRTESNQLTTRQVESLGKVEAAVQQLTATEATLQAKLQTIADGQAQLTAKLGAVEAGQASAATASKEQVAGLEKTTREGLERVASSLESQEALTASVRELLPLLKDEATPAAATEEESVSPASEEAVSTPGAEPAPAP